MNIVKILLKSGRYRNKSHVIEEAIKLLKKKRQIMGRKKGQITVFIMVALLIIAAIILFLVFRTGVVPGVGRTGEVNPRIFLSSCLEDDVKTSSRLISSQGGYIENPLNKSFDGKQISYLCYNQNNYFPCINQEPLIIQHLKQELHSDLGEEVENCFTDLTNSLDSQGYVVDARYRGFDINLLPGRIVIDINGQATLTKSGETTTQENFQLNIPSKIYDLAIISQEIISQEAEFCEFNHLGFMLLHPNTNVFKRQLGESTIIYGITDKRSQENFWFAVRSCALPGGV